jgi:hypothetical protein
MTMYRAVAVHSHIFWALELHRSEWSDPRRGLYLQYHWTRGCSGSGNTLDAVQKRNSLQESNSSSLVAHTRAHHYTRWTTQATINVVHPSVYIQHIHLVKHYKFTMIPFSQEHQYVIRLKLILAYFKCIIHYCMAHSKWKLNGSTSGNMTIQ